MATNKINTANGWLPIVAAILLLVFWLSYAIFLPMKDAYVNWVLDSDWVWINTIGYCGSLISVFALSGIHECITKKKTFTFLYYCSAIIGIIVLTSLIFFEAFILKGIALYSPEIVKLNEGFYKELPFFIANLSGGIFFSVGIIGLCFAMIFDNTFKKWKLILLIIGAPLFGIVLMPGNIRLLGVLCYVIGFIGIGIEMIKKRDQKVKIIPAGNNV